MDSGRGGRREPRGERGAVEVEHHVTQTSGAHHVEPRGERAALGVGQQPTEATREPTHPWLQAFRETRVAPIQEALVAHLRKQRACGAGARCARRGGVAGAARRGKRGRADVARSER